MSDTVMPTCSKPSSMLLVVVHNDGEVERQGRSVFDLAHGEGRGDIGQIDLADQALVERVIGLDVGDDHAHQIIDVPAHAVKLDHFGKFVDDAGEFAHPGFVVLISLDDTKTVTPTLTLAGSSTATR